MLILYSVRFVVPVCTALLYNRIVIGMCLVDNGTQGTTVIHLQAKQHTNTSI